MEATSKKGGNQTAIIAFLAFIALGTTSGLLGLAWPSMQKAFELPLDGVNTLLIVTTATYTLAGFYIGRIMRRLGSGQTLLLGVSLVVVCLFAMSSVTTWVAFIAFASLSGLGSGMIDAGLNMYVAAYHSPRQMNWLHASFGLGITLGPLIMTFVLTHNLGWQSGYRVVAFILLGAVVMFALTLRLWRNEGFQSEGNTPVKRASFKETFRVPAMWLGLATFMAYVGLELGIGQWAYTLLFSSRGIPAEQAGIWVSLYWASFTGGRVAFGLLGERIPVDRQIQFCTGGIILGTFVLWWNPVPIASLIGLIIIAVAQAPVFPLLMAATADRVGAEHAENTISLQMGGVGIGAAVLPGVTGTLGRVLGLEAMAASFFVFAIIVFILYALTRQKQAVRRVALEAAAD